MNNLMKEFKQKTTAGGLRIFLATLLLLIALVVINLLAGLLPATLTELDITPLHMYSVTDTTKRELAKLSEPIDIYMLSAGGESALADEGTHVKSFLEKFPDYNRKIKFEVIDTTLSPTFAGSLGLSETPENLSVIVKSEKRLRVLTPSDLFYYYIEGVGKISAADIQQYVYMLQMYGQSVTPLYYFDGENKLLTALDYVTTNSLPTVYALDGHGELALPTSLTEELDANNIGLETLTLMQSSAIPDNCAMLLIHAPEQDITAAEKSLIEAYLSEGGKLMLITQPGVASLANITALAASYGLTAEDGIVIETDQNHYYQYPYYLFPTVETHALTGTLASEKYVLLPGAHGIVLTEPGGIDTSVIFSSTAASYIVDVNAESAARPEGQNAAEHVVGAVAEAENGAGLIWITSNGFANETANSYTAGGNYAYFLSATLWACDQKEGVKISPLPMETARLVVPSGTATVYSMLLILVIPIAIFAVGMAYWLRRRKK